MAEAQTGKGADKASAKGGDKAAEKTARAQGKGKGGGDGEVKLASAADLVMPKDYVPRLQKLYLDTIRPKLIEQFGYANALQVPHIEKIVLNMGVGEAVDDTEKVTSAAADL